MEIGISFVLRSTLHNIVTTNFAYVMNVYFSVFLNFELNSYRYINKQLRDFQNTSFCIEQTHCAE